MGRLSILMPTFEREGMIGESIASALAQTFDDFVLLIGDNSESDRTEELVASFGDPRIRYHRNRPGLGPMGNWCDLVHRADTELLATLHDDDTWDPTFLEKAVGPMTADREVAMVFCDFWMMDENGRRLVDLTERESARTGRSGAAPGPYTYDRAGGVRLVAVDNAPQPAYAAVIRTDVAQTVEYPSDIEPLYDVWLTYALTQRRAKLFYLDERLTNYRVHAGSETAVSPAFATAEDAFFRRVLDDHADAPQLADEVRNYWGWLRWARGTKLMHHRADRNRSQAEFKMAAADLSGGPKRLAALGAGHSLLAWHAIRTARSLAARR